MRSPISIASLPRPVQAVMLIAAGGGILAGASTLFPWLPMSVVWLVLGIGAVVAFLALLLRRLVAKHAEKGKSRGFLAMLRRPAAGGALAPRDASTAASLDGLRQSFNKGVEEFRSRGKDPYTLPWYLLVGPPAAGKTEMIRHSDIGFPAGLNDPLAGIDGTINMDWWFSRKAVILDTAGRVFMDALEAGQHGLWTEFLDMLRRARPDYPINGLILTVSSQSLLGLSEAELEHESTRVNEQLNVIQGRLGVRFPVYVMVTKCDLIPGFRWFFDGYEGHGKEHQIFGWTNPEDLDTPFDADKLHDHLRPLFNRLHEIRAVRLNAAAQAATGEQLREMVDELFGFPGELRKLVDPLQRYLSRVFETWELSAPPLFVRGVYFSSAMREGEELDLELEAAGIDLSQLPGGRAWERDRAFFIRDLYLEKIFPENGLVTRATNVFKERWRRRAILLTSGVAAALAWIGLTFWSLSDLNTNVQDDTNTWQGIAAALRSNATDRAIVDADGRFRDHSTVRLLENVSTGAERIGIRPTLLIGMFVGGDFGDVVDERSGVVREVLERWFATPLIQASLTKIREPESWGLPSALGDPTFDADESERFGRAVDAYAALLAICTSPPNMEPERAWVALATFLGADHAQAESVERIAAAGAPRLDDAWPRAISGGTAESAERALELAHTRLAASLPYAALDRANVRQERQCVDALREFEVATARLVEAAADADGSGLSRDEASWENLLEDLKSHERTVADAGAHNLLHEPALGDKIEDGRKAGVDVIVASVETLRESIATRATPVSTDGSRQSVLDQILDSVSAAAGDPPRETTLAKDAEKAFQGLLDSLKDDATSLEYLLDLSGRPREPRYALVAPLFDDARGLTSLDTPPSFTPGWLSEAFRNTEQRRLRLTEEHLREVWPNDAPPEFPARRDAQRAIDRLAAVGRTAAVEAYLGWIRGEDIESLMRAGSRPPDGELSFELPGVNLPRQDFAAFSPLRAELLADDLETLRGLDRGQLTSLDTPRVEDAQESIEAFGDEFCEFWSGSAGLLFNVGPWNELSANLGDNIASTINAELSAARRTWEHACDVADRLAAARADCGTCADALGAVPRRIDDAKTEAGRKAWTSQSRPAPETVIASIARDQWGSPYLAPYSRNAEGPWYWNNVVRSALRAVADDRRTTVRDRIGDLLNSFPYCPSGRLADVGELRDNASARGSLDDIADQDLRALLSEVGLLGSSGGTADARDFAAVLPDLRVGTFELEVVEIRKRPDIISPFLRVRAPRFSGDDCYSTWRSDDIRFSVEADDVLTFTILDSDCSLGSPSEIDRVTVEGGATLFRLFAASARTPTQDREGWNVWIPVGNAAELTLRLKPARDLPPTDQWPQCWRDLWSRGRP